MDSAMASLEGNSGIRSYPHPTGPREWIGSRLVSGSCDSPRGLQWFKILADELESAISYRHFCVLHTHSRHVPLIPRRVLILQRGFLLVVCDIHLCFGGFYVGHVGINFFKDFCLVAHTDEGLTRQMS
jgi:hypothetical protein